MRSNSRQPSVISRQTLALLIATLCAFAASAGAQQYTFDEVASGLKHPDVGTRLKAIQILVEADYPEASAPIGNALGDADDRVQLAAIAAQRSLFTLRPISRRTKVGFIIERRTTSGGDAAAEGQLALKARAVPPHVLGGLVLALSDSNPRVRAEAVDLTALLAPIACPVVRANDGPVLSVDGGCAQVGNALVENINSREAPIRRAAMQALGRLRYPGGVQALLDQYGYYQKGPDAYAALEGLAGIGHAAAVSTFEELLTSPNAGARRLAVEGLARARSRDSLPALQTLAQSERSPEVLLALHFANLEMGVSDSTVAHLLGAAGDRALRPLAIRYLLDLAPGVSRALLPWLKDGDPNLRRLVADVLGFSGDQSIVPSLTDTTKDADPDVALAATRALERLKL